MKEFLYIEINLKIFFTSQKKLTWQCPFILSEIMPKSIMHIKCNLLPSTSSEKVDKINEKWMIKKTLCSSIHNK